MIDRALTYVQKWLEPSPKGAPSPMSLAYKALDQRNWTKCPQSGPHCSEITNGYSYEYVVLSVLQCVPRGRPTVSGLPRKFSSCLHYVAIQWVELCNVQIYDEHAKNNVTERT